MEEHALGITNQRHSLLFERVGFHSHSLLPTSDVSIIMYGEVPISQLKLCFKLLDALWWINRMRIFICILILMYNIKTGTISHLNYLFLLLLLESESVKEEIENITNGGPARSAGSGCCGPIGIHRS